MRLYRTSVVCACAVLFASIVAFGASETVDGITWYVNGTTGLDSNSGMSQSSAKATIQAAIDASSDGDTILVAPGTYERFASNNKRIRICSIGGAAVTVVDGFGNYVDECELRLAERDSSTDGVVTTNTVLEGFTVQQLPSIVGGTIKRCIIRDNNCWSMGGAACNYAVVENCLVLNNRGMNGAAADGCILRNCTMVGNSARDINGVCMNSILENCIVYGNGNDNRSTWQYWLDRNPMVTSVGYREKNVYVGDAGFVDAANGDYRLAGGSPCIDAGDNSFVTSETDLGGNVRIVNGTVDIGCYEYGSSLMDGLVAYWPFDGNANDASGNGHHGTTHGVTSTADRFGNENGAYYFGAGNYITVPANDQLNAVTNFTLSAWVCVDSWYGSHIPIMSKGTGMSDTRQYGLELVASGYLGSWGYYDYTSCFEIARASSDSEYVFTNNEIPLGEWIHVAVTRGNGETRAYLNGNEIGLGIAISVIPLNTENLDIGRDFPGSTEYLNGVMDEVRLYNRALSAAEMKALYDGTAVTPQPIVAYTVTFDANGGSVSPAVLTVSPGSSLGTLPTPTREGYSFAGWWTAADDGVQISASTTVSSDVTYYAHWAANSYSIVYDANGGLGTVDATGATYDSEVTIAANEFTWVAHVFAGWATNVLGEVVYSAGQHVMNLTAQPNGVVTLYAVWEPLVVAAPTVVPVDGSVFTEDSCTITISCATEGATIYYGVNAVPRKRPGNIYSAPFTISDTATIYAFAEKEGVVSGNPIEVKITKQTLLGAAAGADARSKSFPWTTGGNADWEPFKDASVDSGASVRSGAISDAADYDEWSETWLETKVPGAGTITFKWKVECEDDGTANDTWDHVVFFVDGMEIARMDGNSGWRVFSYAINGSGMHTLRWAFRKDDYNDEEYSDSAWLSEFVWKPVPPSVRGDTAAIVTGDADSGFTVRPSSASGAVEVTIPGGVDAAKVTVEVAPTVESVTPHGATIKIVKGGHDITPFLDVPAANADGVIDMTAATVKAAIVKEPLDTSKGAEIDLKPTAPSITTAPTRPGLTYTFSEGTTLRGMTQKAEKQGDGEPWAPPVTVKDCPSGFYSIGVGK